MKPKPVYHTYQGFLITEELDEIGGVLTVTVSGLPSTFSSLKKAKAAIDAELKKAKEMPVLLSTPDTDEQNKPHIKGRL